MGGEQNQFALHKEKGLSAKAYTGVGQEAARRRSRLWGFRLDPLGSIFCNDVRRIPSDHQRMQGRLHRPQDRRDQMANGKP